MRPRVQRASGIPCALWIWGARDFLQSSGAIRRENAKVVLPVILRCERSEPRRMNWPQAGPSPFEARKSAHLRMTIQECRNVNRKPRADDALTTFVVPALRRDPYAVA